MGKASNLLGYRSGYNEAVLKTVSCKRHVGSNPTPSVEKYAGVVEQGGIPDMGSIPILEVVRKRSSTLLTCNLINIIS